MAKKVQKYDNSSISMLKGEERVRKRPAVIFGSDDLEGCKHAVFEILSNAIDEAREGHGDTIIVTRYEDLSVEVEDFGRGCPVDWNEKEKRYNWELVFCEMYAGGKYGENGENYEYSLGLNGLGSCATQYASEFFDATIRRDGFRYDLHFEKGRNKGGLKKEPTDRGRKTGSRFHWRPDKQVFTDINIPLEYWSLDGAPSVRKASFRRSEVSTNEPDYFILSQPSCARSMMMLTIVSATISGFCG